MTLVILAGLIFSCKPGEKKSEQETFQFLLEQFADLKIMQYQVPGFDSLSLDQKKLLYYLSQAALCGRDIIYDQNYKHNLMIRKTLENIYQTYKGDKETGEWKQFVVYLKRVWFSNGIHHHYASEKIMPEFSKEYFNQLIQNSDIKGFPLKDGETAEAFAAMITPLMFDPLLDAKKVNLDPSQDLVLTSAVNFYEGLNQQEVEAYYAAVKVPGDTAPVSYGLNSKLVKSDGKTTELVYKADGLYGQAISQIVFWLEKAMTVAENDQQKKGLELLVDYYRTGSLKTWDDYNVNWVNDLDSRVDYVNGFIEDYEDPLGFKATWEAVVNFKNLEATRRTEIISRNAQWFEDHAPTDPRHKKKEVKGVSAKVITTAQLGGDCYPATPIGINLPNADWIRKVHGSKSVTMDNITYAYDQAAIGNGFLEEFCYSEDERKLAEKYGYQAGSITTDLHECLGHGSGQLLAGVSSGALKNYQSVLEETRADLFALYYIIDPKLIELGIMPNEEAAHAEYNAYIRNGLMTQLTRIEIGKNIEQAHMRNRALIAAWAFEQGSDEKVIEKKVRDGKTYFVINDYQKLRGLFGRLLKEIQRIKSEGDYEAGKTLVEKYAVKIDPALHKEVKDRFGKLHIAPYGGFVNPVLTPVMKGEEITDILLQYPGDYTGQMLEYSAKYSFLPVRH
ncbi:MAG TPA: dihydrofolate reductase [Bacteroidales bacterium]|nr:dihydrofolate reductase [Bacteroidales bacterium]HSA42719.1 dihydrofolate reductase [Bacteroidales bacterium]